MLVSTNLYSGSWKCVLSGANLSVHFLRQRAVEASTFPSRAILLKLSSLSAQKSCYVDRPWFVQASTQFLHVLFAQKPDSAHELWSTRILE